MSPPFGFANAGFLGIQGTPTLHLATLLYTIQGQYFDPIKKSNQPLPPHYWALYQPRDPTIIMCSGGSTDPETPQRAVGQCTVNAPDPFADGEYALAVYPIPKDVRDAYSAQQEAWIDLTTNLWVTPPPDGNPRLDNRKLVRIPLWTSAMKAYYGGGFADPVPDKAKDYFKKNGLLKKEEIEAFGTKAAPWTIVLDSGWIKAHVRYVFVNWKDGKEETLPPGLVVEATVGDKTVGRGTAIDDADGTAYVLVPGSADMWKTLHFGFRAPAGVRVDLSSPAASPDTRLTSAAPLPPDRNTRNTLPNVWHSKGMPAVYTASFPTAPAPGAARKTWDDLRKDIAGDGSATEPLVVFQLDDVILYDKSKMTSVPAGSRFTLFDHLLRIRMPDSDPAAPHFTQGTFGTPMLDQKTVYTIGAPAPTAPTVMRDLSTRLISFGNKFYDVEEKRVTGTPGKTNCLGARAALLNDHPMADYSRGSPYLSGQGFYELHFINVPGVLDPASSKQLAHMLLYISCKVSENGQPPAKIYAMMVMASERWSQGSPGVPTTPSATPTTKDYRILPKDPAQRNIVIRPRTFFGPVQSGAIMNVNLEAGTDDRSNTGGGVPFLWWMLKDQRMEYYKNALDNDVTGAYGAGQDSDTINLAWHTMAHEFGHALGLPDEYGEELNPKDIDGTGPQDPRIQGYSPPKEGMPTDYRPFFTDGDAMMKSNRLPRLRHLRHHVEALNSDAAFASLPNRPYVLRHETLGGGIEYVRSGDEHAHPYAAEFAGESIPGGYGDCALFPVGQDEGVAEAMFVAQGAVAPTPLAAGSRFDALMIVRSRVRFRFGDADPGKNISGIDAPTRKRLIWKDFISNIYDAKHRLAPGVRFGMTGGNKYSRIAIIVQPVCAYGTAVFTGDDFKMIISNAPTPPANPFAQASVGSTVEMDITHFNVFSVLRAILGAPTATGNAANVTTLGPDDFKNIAKLADSKVGGTHVVVAI